MPFVGGDAAMSFIARVLVLVCVTSSLAVAGQQGATIGSIEIPTGQTAYLQLTSTVATGKPTSGVRVQNPGREHSVVRVTYEVGVDGAANRLRIRNGYDTIVFFKLNDGCSAGTGPAAGIGGKEFALTGVRPGSETTMELPASTSKVVMCEFTVAQ